MELVLKKKFFLFLLLNGFYFFSYFHRVGIPGTIFDQLQMEFNLTANQVASLGTIVLGIYGILQFFVGSFMDFFGTNRIFVAGGFLLCAGSILFSVSHSIFSLYFSRVLVGFGASVAYLGIVKKTDELFGSDFFSVMVGVAIFLGYSGGLFATLPFERLVFAFGWRSTLLWMSGALLVVMIIILTIFIRQDQLRHKTNSISLKNIKQTLLNKGSYPVIITTSLYFTIYFIFQGIIGKKLLQDTCGISSKIAASFTFIMMASTMFFVLFWGAIVRIIKARKNLMISLCWISISACILIISNLVFWKEPMAFFLSFFLFALIGGSGPLTATLMKEINPLTIGTSVGFINGICYLFVAISGNITGLIMNRFSSKTIFTSQAVIYPVAAYITVTGFCLMLGIIALLSSFRIKEVRKVVEIKVPAPF
ncbi:MAG: MFS transporter [Candidatus Omnitrophica bacterium]|nr:MFS transporter [Candidatus Omnitrophota bacterium]